MLNIEKFASLLVNYCLEVKPKQRILVNADISTAALVEEIYKQILIDGAYPEIEFSNSCFTELFYSYANDDQLTNISLVPLYRAKNIDSRIHIESEVNTKTLANISNEKYKIRNRNPGLHKINHEMRKKRWVLTLFPTEGYPQEAEMSLREFSRFVSDAMFLNSEKPSDEWNKLSHYQEKIIEKIKNSTNVHVKSDNVDMKFSLKDRLWMNSDGKRNMPSGEIYTTPVENSVTGYFRTSFPSNKYGKLMDGVFLEFKKGKLLKVEADKNEEFLKTLLNTEQPVRKRSANSVLV